MDVSGFIAQMEPAPFSEPSVLRLIRRRWPLFVSIWAIASAILFLFAR